MAEAAYGFLDRLLHRLALQYGPIAEMSFDLDQSLVRSDADAIAGRRHVFIAGLARAGTTVLMRRFHDTGRFRSLTYRDMPFVLAPNLWRRLSRHSKRNLIRAERAHGDNLQVDADSPESLDEVFWRVFAAPEYLAQSHLRPHRPSPELVRQYLKYVNAILAAGTDPEARYLSKNNNNILRLEAILQAFPNALILIPFREPLQHALSLLRQHRHFSALQAKSPFTLDYMNWLAHHEFGLGHRPFLPAGGTPSASPADQLDYWLHEWCEVYEWLERSKPSAAMFVCYEDLCAGEACWARLAELAQVPAESPHVDTFRLASRSVDDPVTPALRARAAAVYARLVTQARS